jgi:diguanylate cyclase (GGDEF)-like protein
MIAAPTPASGSYDELLQTVAGEIGTGSASLAVLLVNLWNESEIQSRIGFVAGDLLLSGLAQTLTETLRGRGAVLRLGNTGFAVLARGVKNRGHAVLAAEKIWRTVLESPAVEVLATRPELSIGIALFPEHDGTPERLVRKAQLAAASARRRAQRVLVYDDQCAEQLLGQWQLETEFEAALGSGEIEMYFQPKVRMSDRRTGGAEALMRWFRDGRATGPDVFIPLAESPRLLQATTGYALNTALRQAAQWPADASGAASALGVAVNVPPALVHNREFVDMVRSALATWKVANERLTLEITEGALLADPKQAMIVLSKLRDLGVRIAIDDFGTGYSSLSYFRKLSADELKIDKSFILTLLREEADARIVRTIVALAQQFGLAVVAEGVEDEATFVALQALGCDYAQGYLFSRALQQQQFIAWLGAQ